METKHTPGPWKIHNNIGRKGEIGVLADTAPCIIAIMGNQKEWPLKAVANARLIAAAPDLLEACELLAAQEDWQNEDVDSNSPIGKAWAAIAKVKQ